MTAAVTQPTPDITANPFAHIGLFYRDNAQYLAGTTSFIRAALAADQPVMVVVPPKRLTLIADQLGVDAANVGFLDMTVVGRNPGRILPGVLLDFAGRHPGRRVSIIGEPIWPGRTSTEYPACVAHEALINTAFAGRDAAILCLYDARGLAAAALADAHRTHPTIVNGTGDPRSSSEYTNPLQVAARCSEELSSPPAAAATRRYTQANELADLRKFVNHQALRAGLTATRATELVIAVNELATNTLEHAGGAGQVSLWEEACGLVCQVADSGYFSDPLAGRIPPPDQQVSGRGLVLVNQLCDLVRSHSRPGHTTIRVYMYR